MSTQTNIVYGMYSGLALLMDVHAGASPNGVGQSLFSNERETAASPALHVTPQTAPHLLLHGAAAK